MLWNSPAVQTSSLLPQSSNSLCVPLRCAYSVLPLCRVLPALAGPSRNCLCSSRIIERPCVSFPHKGDAQHRTGPAHAARQVWDVALEHEEPVRLRIAVADNVGLIGVE